MYDSGVYFRDLFNTAASGMDVQTNYFRAMKQITAFVAPGLSNAYQAMENASATAATVSHRFGRAYTTPSFNIHSTVIHGQAVRVTEEAITSGPFGVLKHFKREFSEPQGEPLLNQPKVLLVAPMSGHHATLFRDTVRELLPDHDIYVTDWIDARMVPINAGPFTLDDQIDYTKHFITTIGPDVHILGYSQSTIPVLSAVSLLAAEQSAVQPLSMTLVAGPIDPTINETKVGKFARDHSMSELEHVISYVPYEYPGGGRPVYSGKTQLAALSCANPSKQIEAYNALIRHTYLGHTEEAAQITEKLNEYESTFDIPRNHWLDMIRFFKTNPFGNGTMHHSGTTVNPAAIKNTAILTLEGGKDNIVAPGQTSVVHGLTPHLPLSMKFSHVVAKADHYTVLNADLVAQFIRIAANDKGTFYDCPVNRALSAPADCSRQIENKPTQASAPSIAQKPHSCHLH